MDTMIDDTSDSESGYDSHHLLEARTSRQWLQGATKMLRARARHVQEPLVIIILVLITLCVSQGAWIVYMSEGLYRVPGDRQDKLFGASIARSSPSIWDDEYQSFLREANPVLVHSHNDYSRRVPLFEALASGCISFEADVHLHDLDLFVGHNSWELEFNSNLRSMYLDPLERIIRAWNINKTTIDWHGVFDSASHQTVVLLIDLKTE